MFPRNGKRPPCRFLVPGVGNHNRNFLERADCLQRFQRVDDDDVAALHIVDAGAGRLVTVAYERIEVVFTFEHRVEVPDQHELRSRPVELAAEQVSRALQFRRQVDPLGFEPQGVQFASHDVADLPHAVMVHRATRDVHGFLEQRDGILGMSIDPLDHALLIGIEPGSAGRPGQEKHGQDQETLDHC